MGKVLLDLAVSLDGYIDGPDGADVGLYDWYAATSGPNADIAAETVATTGAIVVGRGVFGRGDDATGWDETPYEVPHFVVTHRPPRAAGGPVDFRFVEGVREAVAAAQEAAGDRYATIGGGADIAATGAGPRAGGRGPAASGAGDRRGGDAALHAGFGRVAARPHPGGRGAGRDTPAVPRRGAAGGGRGLTPVGLSGGGGRPWDGPA